MIDLFTYDVDIGGDYLAVFTTRRRHNGDNGTSKLLTWTDVGIAKFSEPSESKCMENMVQSLFQIINNYSPFDRDHSALIISDNIEEMVDERRKKFAQIFKDSLLRKSQTYNFILEND